MYYKANVRIVVRIIQIINKWK